MTQHESRASEALNNLLRHLVEVEGWTRAEIAQAAGLSENSIAVRCRSLGLDSARPGRQKRLEISRESTLSLIVNHGVPVVEVAEMVGLTQSMITKMLRGAAVPPLRDTHKRVDDAQREKIVELRKQKFNQSQIAEEVGVSQPTVARVLRHAAEKPGALGTRKTRKGQFDGRVEEMRALQGEGFTHKQIAERIGCSRPTVARLLKLS